MTWRDLWELFMDIEREFPDDAFTARELLDILQKRITEKMVEHL